MLYLPSLDLILTEYSTRCERYLVTVAGAVTDPPYRHGGYTEAPPWLVDALHYAAACGESERGMADTGRRY